MTIICYDCERIIGETDEVIPEDYVTRCSDCTVIWMQDEEYIWYFAEAKEC